MADEVKKPKPLVWNCKVSPLDNQSKEVKDITVGQKVGLICQGDALKEVLEQPLSILELNEEDKYKAKVLETRSVGIDRADLVATSYKPGDHSKAKLALKGKNGQVQIQIDGLSVKTVIEQKPGLMQQPQQQKPYGVVMPIEQQLPTWYYIFWTVLALAILGFIIRKSMKFYQRRQLLENMEQFKSALGAYGQFNKDIRHRYKVISVTKAENLTTEKAHEFLAKIKEDFDMYLVRELTIPAHIWGRKEIIGEVKKRHPKLYKKHGTALIKILQELEKSLNAKQLGLKDCEQMVEMARKVSGSIHKHIQGVKS